MSFFSDFTGKSARKDATMANAAANRFLKQGYGQQQDYYNQAASAYDPYVQAGSKASDFYNNALGLNGADARAQAQGVITSDPIWQGQLGQESNALARLLNARGQSGGGTAALAGQRVMLQNYNNALDRYRDAGSQGFQATGAQSNLRAAQGDAAMGYGATRAGQAINYGNALASTRGTGINNLIGLLGTAAKAYTAGR